MNKIPKNAAAYLLIIIILSLNPGCSPQSPSDEEAAGLVKDYYLFFHSGKQVEVKIVRRGESIKENKSFPIEFIVIPAGREGFRKTFYFFRKEDGKFEVREFTSG